MELSEIREKIDRIDSQLLDLFLQRLECSDAAADIKKQGSTSALNAPREKQILDEIAAESGDSSYYAVKLFRALLELSRERMVRRMDGDFRDSGMGAEIAGIRENETNIVLIGMPGCGKTTIANILGKMTGRPVIETDDIVAEDAGCSIPEIFASEGEDGFRERESRAVLKVCSASGAVIATGGGTVTRAENYLPLHRNGILYHLERDTRLLEKEGRPLSQMMDMEEMYRRRRQMYLAFRDRTADNNGRPEDAAAQVWEDFVETAKRIRF
ncbi:MAG: chorismate mutase [Oscillospiraceae bacterium]|nr:chorismate mutase [Oscillospiraceae bacterium]